MAERRRDSLYIWATWASSLLAGEKHCEWSVWFRAQHVRSSYTQMPSNFNQTEWMAAHTALVRQYREEWEDAGYSISLENQNSFALRGTTTTLAGKPDIVASRGDDVVVIDANTGRPKIADAMQVMLYMFALPRTQEQYQGCIPRGIVAYPDHLWEIPVEAVNQEFITKVGNLMRRLGDDVPARLVPSSGECRFCPITSADCRDRADNNSGPNTGETDAF